MSIVIIKLVFYQIFLGRTKENNFKFEISFSGLDLNSFNKEEKSRLDLIAKRLDSLTFEHNDRWLEFGFKTLAFGYPLLIKRSKDDPKKIIKAPLFLWYIDIEKSSRTYNTWTFSRNEDFGFGLNKVLNSYLIANDGLVLDLDDKELNDTENTTKYISKIIKQLSIKLNFEIKLESLRIEKCPSTSTIDSITPETPWIQWSGIVGFYSVRKESIKNDLKEIIRNYNDFNFENLKVEKLRTSTLTPISTDPSQESLLQGLDSQNTQIIQGPPGTGKSQSLTAVITNALLNKRRCLVVCEKKTALDVIYNNLQKVGLDKYCLLIDDVYRDRKKVIDQVRAFSEPQFSLTRNYQFILDRETEINSLKKLIAKNYKNVAAKAFGDSSWKDIVGRYLKARGAHDTIFNIDISPSFQPEEYRTIKRELVEVFAKFKKVEKYISIFCFLEDDHFKFPYSKNREIELTLNLKNTYDEGAKIFNKLTKYQKQSDKYYHSYGHINKNSLALRALISKKYKIILESRLKLDQEYSNLLVTLENFYDKLIEIKSSENIHFKETNSKNIIVIKNELLSVLKHCNAFLKYQDFYRLYHDWMYSYSQLGSVSTKIFDALKKTRSNNIEANFDYWYFSELLRKKELDLTFPTDEESLVLLDRLEKELQKSLPLQIASIWDNIRFNAIQRFDSIHNFSLKTLYNYRKNKKFLRKNSLRLIIETDTNFFLDFFPILLLNPVVCSSILPLREGLYDYVIFDEASQLKVEDVFASFIRGKYKIVSGDVHQMPPSNFFESRIDDEVNENTNVFDPIGTLVESESLLEYTENMKPNRVSLDFHYRSNHPLLINFSNAAFYGQKLIPMPEKYKYKPIKYFQINGIYENNTNELEALRIVEFLLLNLKKEESGDYPSIGVATFNISQRNLILKKLFDHSENNENLAKKYELLKDKGLFVKNLENIQGDERDIIIISTTFGKNRENIFRQNFGPLNQEKGYKLLNVIITRAKKELLVFTSFPEEYISRYEQELVTKGNTGKGILYAYLAYAKAVSKNNHEKISSILSLLKKNSEETNYNDMDWNLIESPFEDEIYQYLTRIISKDQIVPQYRLGGFRIDFVVLDNSKKKPLLAIECDGASFHSSDYAYSYDLHRQKILENYGLKIYRIWSTNWWINSDLEFRKLVSFVRKYVS